MRLFGRWFARPSSEPDSQRDTHGELPAAGHIYAFRTSPYSEFAPPETGRFASFKLLAVSEKHVSIAVLEGIWSSPPSLAEAKRARILRENRFNQTGRPAVFGVNRAGWKPADYLDEIMLIGSERLSREERAHADAIANFAVGTSFASLRYVNYAAEGEWRWGSDREAFVAESGLAKAKNDAERAANEARYRTRLSKITWEQLLSETPFERWSPSPPYPPADFTRAGRQAIHDACRQLSDLGPKPRKAAVRAILRDTVKWFNEADERAGGVIETEEREDIYAVLEEMAYAARQKALIEEIDEWREW